MKLIFGLILLAGMAWYGVQRYQQGDLPWLQGPLEAVFSSEKTKCITADGQVFYGEVPRGVDCERIEPVEGSLAVVSGEDFHRLDGGHPQAAGGGSPASAAIRPGFGCDGRTHCSQMTSCAEARFFLTHCPGVQMDGNDDGVPCERQWCGG